MSNPFTCRLAMLREEMEKRGVSLYLILNSDFHGSEYIGEYFRSVAYLTGFTGSAATVVVTPDQAYLWTDGRYFIQAGRQLLESGVILQRVGEEGVPTVEAFVRERLTKGGCLGFDGKVVSAKMGAEYQKIAEEKQARLLTEEDLLCHIWKDRPKLAKNSIFLLEETYAGQSVGEKLALVRDAMERAGADVHLLSSLCDIAWLLNIRGSDIRHVPVVLSHLAVSRSECVLFLQEDVITEEQKKYFKENRITVEPYEAVDTYAASLEDTSVLFDPSGISSRIIESLRESVRKIEGQNPTERLKAVKNETEQRNIRIAHIKDGVAVTKFLYWVKNRIGKEPITERSAAAYLEEKRKEQEHFLELSFDTICAYGANAAMMHYEATEESDAVLKPEGFLLVDSGGHYLEGTTDVTRTVALGALTDSMRSHFTAVLRGNLNLAAAKFLYGCSGSNLDILAREPLWSIGMDYKCGTGHGVGYLLNVHEGPNAFRYRHTSGKDSTAVFEEGMVTTDEPGVYLENEYGIRIENELLCKKAEKNEYGQFMEFETITYVPIDLDAVDADAMTKRERSLLNAYHKQVYEAVSPYLTDKEKQWLKECTRAV